MTLWIVLTIMTSAAAVLVSVPLIRRFERRGADAGGDVAVYRDQLHEVDRERRDGLIDDSQVETARIEIKRRILAADRRQAADLPGLSGIERSVAVVGATAVVVLGSTILYAVTGSPDLAVRPPLGAAGFAGGAGDVPALPPRHPAAGDAAGDGEAGLPTVEEMTRRLAARLARNPDDTDGWRTLGWSYINVGRFEDAAEAYGQAIARDPGNVEFRDGRIEALVGAAGGVVTPAVRDAIGEALQRDPSDSRARYFSGLASAQDGDRAGALAAWSAVLAHAAAGAHVEDGLLSDLRKRVGDLRRELGMAEEDAGAAPAPMPRVTRPREDATPSRGPVEQQVRAAGATAPADRTTMIRTMVEGLSDRLERSPRDAEGWIRLIRSRVVLGEGDLAKQALARGLAAFADDTGERDRIAAAAQELGVR